jgi:hypothetical protein
MQRPEDFGRIIVTRRGGAPIRVDQVARVSDGAQELDSLALYNGQRTLLLSVQKAQDENTIEVVDGLVKAIADIRRTIAKVEGIGSVRVREGESLDANGNLPIFVELGEREQNLLGVSARYSTVDGPGVRAYYANRNLFGGGETFRLDADIYYLGLGFDPFEQQRKAAGIDTSGLGGRLSATFVKPALDGSRNDLLANVISRLSPRKPRAPWSSHRAGVACGRRPRSSSTTCTSGTPASHARSRRDGCLRLRDRRPCHAGAASRSFTPATSRRRRSRAAQARRPRVLSRVPAGPHAEWSRYGPVGSGRRARAPTDPTSRSTSPRLLGTGSATPRPAAARSRSRFPRRPR